MLVTHSQMIRKETSLYPPLQLLELKVISKEKNSEQEQS